MIEFREKLFTEFDAMHTLYNELMADQYFRNNIKVIDKKSLIPILKGNNVVIERFVITTQRFGKDKFRLYLKVGAKAKMPDEFKLPSDWQTERLGNAAISFGNKFNGQPNNNNNQQKQQQQQGQKNMSDVNGAVLRIPDVSIQRDVEKLLGEAIEYNKKERSIVLEFTKISDVLKALKILPFGIKYNLYLLA